MKGSPALPQFEQLLLTAVLTLEDDAYGVTIHARVQELCAPKRVALGAVYVTLERLERKGLLASWQSAPTAARGGRAKRCFKLTPSGERALRDSAVTIQRLHKALNRAWGVA
jgi:PadR family transcriptional regulator PadR